MTEPLTLLADLQAHLREVLKDPALELAPETPLLSSGRLDSYQLLDLVEWLEDRCEVAAMASDVTPENFETPAKIAAWVEAKRSGGARA